MAMTAFCIQKFVGESKRHSEITKHCKHKSSLSNNLASRITMSRNPFSGGPVEMGIRKKLMENLKPTHLEVINESYKHNTYPKAESHFKMVVVSDMFKDMPLVKRHQAINSLLTEELKTSVHAISIDAKTPEQWNAKPEINPTPKCLGGFGR